MPLSKRCKIIIATTAGVTTLFITTAVYVINKITYEEEKDPCVSMVSSYCNDPNDDVLYSKCLELLKRRELDYDLNQ